MTAKKSSKNKTKVKKSAASSAKAVNGVSGKVSAKPDLQQDRLHPRYKGCEESVECACKCGDTAAGTDKPLHHQPAESMALDQPIEGVFSDMSERLMKIQRDLMMPAFVFERAGIQNTITFFGSAQIKSPEVAAEALESLKKKAAGKKNLSDDFAAKLQKAKMDLKMSRYYADAEELASRLQEWSNILNVSHDDKFYIMTGGGPGIMEAANKGARKAGGKTAGLTILIPDEQRRNDYVSLDAWVNFNYFLMRKFWLLFFAKALVVFPGGTGTFDEFFEVVTLMKTRKTHNYIPTVLFGKEFWSGAVDFKYLVKTGVISSKDLSFFRLEDSVDEAAEYITSELERIYF